MMFLSRVTFCRSENPGSPDDHSKRKASMIPIAIPNLSGNEAKYLAQCVETGFVSSVGSFVSEFADSVADKSGASHSAPLATGTAGLHLALLTAGVRENDLVILPSLTFIASANAVAYCGALPWLTEVAAESWTLDPHQLAEMLERETKVRDGAVYHLKSGRRVAAVMPVYMLGLPADMDAINAVAATYQLPVISDAAAALGSLYKDRPVGALKAMATVFSFNGNKTFTCGGGGAVVSESTQIIDHVNHLATTARNGPHYDHDEIGFNYRMTNLNAAVGCAQLERFDDFVAQKRSIAQTYKQAFADIDMISNFPEPAWATSVCWLSGITLDLPSDQTQAFIEKLRKAGVDARPFWKPVHLQKPYKHAETTALSFTEALYSRIIPLPCSTHISALELEHVINAVRTISKEF